MRSRSLRRSFCAAAILLVLAAPSAVSCSNGAESATSNVAVPLLLPVPTMLESSSTYKWGYIDTSGAWVIQPQFEKAYGFEDALAAVEVGDRWGYVDRSGRLVVQPQFTEAHGFSEGLARVATLPAPSGEPGSMWPFQSAAGWGFIDTTGRMVIPATYEEAGYFSEGLAPVMAQSKCGFINAKGEVVIPLRYDAVGEFSEGLAAVLVGGKWGYVTTGGLWAVRPVFPGAGGDDASGVYVELGPLSVGPFHGGLARIAVPYSIMNQDGSSEAGSNWAYIDKSGSKVFGRQYESAGDFSEGLAPIFADGSWAFIDASGRRVLTGDLQDGSQNLYLLSDSGFHEGLVAVKVDEKVGYMDKTGRMVIAPQFYLGHAFERGVAYVLTLRATPATTTSTDSEGPPPSRVGSLAVIDKTGRIIYQAPAGTQYKPSP